MKLLLDENLSPQLIDLLAPEFPDSTHIERLNMRGATDAAVWAFARERGYTIVSKDNDFRQHAFLYAAAASRMVVRRECGNHRYCAPTESANCDPPRVRS